MAALLHLESRANLQELVLTQSEARALVAVAQELQGERLALPLRSLAPLPASGPPGGLSHATGAPPTSSCRSPMTHCGLG